MAVTAVERTFLSGLRVSYYAQDVILVRLYGESVKIESEMDWYIN